MSSSSAPSSPVDPSSFRSVVGIDIGSQTCRFCPLKPDKSQVIKPTDFTNAPAGFALLLDKLERLGVSPEQILIGLEATSRYGENLSRFLESRGFQWCLLHPRQTHQVAQQRGRRAKTDKLDATTIARVLLSGEARRGSMPTEVIATYRELARLQTQLTEDSTRYRNEIHALLQVLFPEFNQVFADPCRPTALALLKLYPRAQAFGAAGVEPIVIKLHERAPRNYGLHTAEQLVSLAQRSVSSGVALPARRTRLKMLCDQLEHTQANLIQVEKELETLVKTDTGAKGLQSVPEFAGKTIAVVRAELGDVDRFTGSSQAVAYAGLDIEVKHSGQSKGQAKLSKRGSGRIRRILYMAVVRCIRLKDSAFGAYYHHLVARGLPRRAAMMAVMRKMLMVAYRLLKTQETYDPAKVFAQAVVHSPASEPQPVHPQLAPVGA